MSDCISLKFYRSTLLKVIVICQQSLGGTHNSPKREHTLRQESYTIRDRVQSAPLPQKTTYKKALGKLRQESHKFEITLS